ncbi:MAG TPA: hypothetical protein VGL23_03220 [Chloroflexota bacterium]
MSAGTIVVAGALAQKAGQGGHAWVLLQYLLGLRRLGWEVVFLDRLDASTSAEAAPRLGYVAEVMQRFDLGGAYAVICEGGERFVGLSRAEVLERTRRSALLLNVMGFLTDPEILGLAPRRVFLDIDPGFGQMWRELGLHDPFRGHDAFVTIGENLGQPGCAIPTCGLDWITTRQPIVLERWPRQSGEPGRFTSVASWRGAYGPVEYGGRTYGLRVHEFRRLAELPRLSGQAFELALDIHPADTRDRALLETSGWTLVDPRAVAGDPWAYQAYVQRSRGEFMVAKNMYVQARSGWFSDRSICYLASGRPVVAQDTGFARSYRTREGLVPFSDLDEAAAAVEAVAREYQRHARAARAVAEELFDSDRVLGRLLGRLGVAA